MKWLSSWKKDDAAAICDFLVFGWIAPGVDCEIGNRELVAGGLYCEIIAAPGQNCEMSASFLLALALGWLSQAQRAMVVGQGLGNLKFISTSYI